MIGTQDMVLFMLVMLLLFGAKKLPELARGLGKTMGEFKKAREEFDQEITHAVTQGESEAKAKDPTAK
jgi:sec-independent protein translocase protein TatA